MTPSSGALNILLLLMLWVAPGIAGQAEQGTFEVRIKDHREAIDDFSRLLLTIDSVAVSPKPRLRFWQTSWKEFSPSPPSVDLTKYGGKESARIFRADVDAGAFDAFHLKIKSVDGLLKQNRRGAPVKRCHVRGRGVGVGDRTTATRRGAAARPDGRRDCAVD